MQARGWKLWNALGDTLAETGLLADYDLIFIDTPPALGYLTINGLATADVLLVPTGASVLEFESTGRFFDMLHSTFAAIEEGENIAARAIGQPETAFTWDAVRLLVTRFDSNRQGEFAGLMQAYLGRTLASQRQEVTALIGLADEQVSAIYEADYRDFNRETYMRGRESFDATWAGVKRLLYGIWRRDEKAGTAEG
jgi:chromosome partitioning protein